jgi:hypothetical protein
LWCTGWVKPAYNVEFFLKSLFESTKQNGGGRPGLFDAAFLVTRYRSEFGLLAIPSAVQKLLFPVLLVIGRLLGKYEKYKEAPEPVKL